MVSCELSLLEANFSFCWNFLRHIDANFVHKRQKCQICVIYENLDYNYVNNRTIMCNEIHFSGRKTMSLSMVWIVMFSTPRTENIVENITTGRVGMNSNRCSPFPENNSNFSAIVEVH